MTFCPPCYRDHTEGKHAKRSNYGEHATDTADSPAASCDTCRTPTMTIAATDYCAAHGLKVWHQMATSYGLVV